MSKQSLEQVIIRAATSPTFRAQLDADPEGALLDYDLTREEARALETRDRKKLVALGLDRSIVDLLDWWAPEYAR